MFRNYLKVAIRYLRAHKGYSFINILGLAVGITSCVLIMLFVRSEFSYDKFHSKADRLYRVWQHEKYEGEDFINVVTPLPMAGAIQKSYPDVEATCRIYNFNPMVRVNQNSFSESVHIVDSSFFQLFDFRLLQGNQSNPFPAANSLLLTPAVAKKYFGTANAIGKNIEIQLGDTKELFTVAGIVDAAPEASSIKYQMLIPFSNAKYIFRPRLFTNWFNVFNETYVLLRSNVKAEELERKLIKA